MPVFLYDGHGFPPSAYAESEPNGLLAVSQTLTADDILSAYTSGIFPWSNPDEPILWWAPNPRMVLFPKQFRMTRSLRKIIRNRAYQIRLDSAFESVMRACARATPNRPETWISEPYISAYTALHRRGFAHSVEVWAEDTLVGGLYGVALGGVFFGESMFSVLKDTSKIAAAFLAFFMQKHGFGVIDCQLPNPHLASLGAVEIARESFESLLHTHQSRRPQVNWAMTSDILSEFRALAWKPVLPDVPHQTGLPHINQQTADTA